MTNQADRIKIAEMLGWTEIRNSDCGGHHFLIGIPPKCGPEVLDFVPDFFNDASAANEVVVAMTKRGLTFKITLHAPAPGSEEEPSWEVVLEDCYPQPDVTVAEWHAGGTGPTAASYICQVALQAVAEAERTQ